MTNKVTVADYGTGNLLSVCRALEYCGAEVMLASTAQQVVAADRLVVPGVGSFAACMEGLRRTGLDDAICRHASAGRPLLGICVGMQMLFEASEEFGNHAGLALLAGQVFRIPATCRDGTPHKVPHIGWNAIHPVDERSWHNTILESVTPGSAAYFVHSFTAAPTQTEVRLANADYDGCRITATVSRNNIHGCQFHPEKSAAVGLAILGKFMRL